MNPPVASLPAKLIELADFAEETDNRDLMPDGGGEARCVFLNMRPEAFQSLIREAASALARELFGASHSDKRKAAIEALASPAIPPGYDRELIARMLFDYSNISGGRYEAQSARKQAQLISEADNATGEAVTVNRSPAMAGSAGEELADRLDRYCAKWDAQVQWSGNDMAALLQDAGEAADLIHRLATPEQPGSAVQGEVVAYRLWNGNGWDYSQRPFPGYAAQPLYTTPPPAPAAEQGKCDGFGACNDMECIVHHPEQPEARGVEGSCEDPRLKAAGYYVCGSNANREWHFRRPNGEWQDRFRSEEAAVDAALREIAATPNPVRAEWLDIPPFLRRDATPEEHAAWEAKQAEQPGSGAGGAVAWTSQTSMEMLRESGTAVMGALRTDYCNVPLYTTPPPAGAAEQGQCNHDEADVCPKCELRWRSLTERPAATQPEARGVEGMVREAIKICSSFNTPQDMADYLNDELRSLAATPNPVRAEQPEGEWKLLPVEPTTVMRAAGKDAHYEAEKAVEDGGNENFARFGLRENRVMHVYAAMLAAAPAAPGAAVGVDE